MNKLYKNFSSSIVLILTLFFVAIPTSASQTVDSGYLAVSGGKLFYQTFGSGTPMIVLHGGPGLDQSYLLPQMIELADHNKVTFYDQRGSGKSLGFTLDKKTVNMAVFVEDLEKIRKKLGYDKFVLAGHSFGGTLAMHYAIAYPEHLSAMLLIDSGPADAEHMQDFLTEYARRMKPLQPKLDLIQNSAAFKNYEAQAVNEYYRQVFSVYFYPASNVKQLTLNFTPESAKSSFIVAGLMNPGWYQDDLRPKLRSLRVPTLIVHGEYDVVPVSVAEDIQQSIPQSKLVVIKNSDHFPYIDQPKQFFAAVNDFLSSGK